MSVHFHEIAIKEVRKETAECVSLLFDIPSHLQDKFRFTQGQNLTIKKTIDGEEVRRTYSLCSSPLDNEWRIAVKKVDEGLFSSFANTTLKAGDILEVMEPIGRFYTPLSPANAKNYLAFVAGSGITPVLSLIKTTLATEPKSSFTLVYGNRSKSTIIFFEELEALKNKYLQRFQVVHVLSRERTETEINAGRIDTNKLAQLQKLLVYASYDEFFACGPEQMIFSVKDFLEAQGIDKKKIHFELFTTPGQSSTSTATKISSAPKEGSEITLQLDGRSMQFHLASQSNQTLLDAALEQGADLPYACKGGVCCTCKAKLLEGTVEMDVHWGLEEDEIEQGFILTCQAHPTSQKVVVDFDIK